MADIEADGRTARESASPQQGTSDSAGVPWAGRSFDAHPAVDDDGSAPVDLLDILTRFRSGDAVEASVVAIVRTSRLLVPLVARAGAIGTNLKGDRVDKSQELSIVTVSGPDGRNVLPVFTSVDAMSSWNPNARPVPVDAARVALAAAAEGTDLVVVDPTSPTEFVLRRPALAAIARSVPWTPCYLDDEVLDAFLAAADPEESVVAVQLAPGDPDARLAGAELLVHLSLRAGLDRGRLDALMARLGQRWAESPVIAERVDSLDVRLALT